MKNKYRDLIHQTFEFPQSGFHVEDDELYFHNIRLLDIIEQYGTPLKISYLPKITSQIQRAKKMFAVGMAKADYKGKYTYCYCTKSSHFAFVLEEALKNDIHLETSSGYDMHILRELFHKGLVNKDTYIINNGCKKDSYKEQILEFINDGFTNIIPILDNINEINYYKKHITEKTKIGIRVACDEEPKYAFYTSRLGVKNKHIVPFYEEKIATDERFELKMLHFFINTGMRDTVYYWTELSKILQVYCDLKKICPTLDSLNIGGGLPIQNSLNFDYDYEYMIEEVVSQIKSYCNQQGVEEPNLFTEFGSFTVGESGATFYSVMDQKMQNDTEIWCMIDSSFMTTLPDTYSIDQKFIMLAVNHWDKEHRRVNLGGITCDSMDYYNTEAHASQVYLPNVSEDEEKPLYIGFFHTGAYQESLGGYGGIQHCLIPAPKHVIIDKNEDGSIVTSIFGKEQTYKSMLKILGY